MRIGVGSIGWGILGTGERAAQMVNEAIRQQPPVAPDTAGSWVVGVYSHSEQRAHSFAHDCYLPHSFSNLADLLQRREIDCVYIASHPRHHFPLTMAALAAGKHVLCETPMALTLEEAQTMQLAAAHRGLLLGVGHPLRADPAIRQLQHLLASGTIGDLLGGRFSNTTPLTGHQQSWRLQDTAGGVLRNRTPHAIDLLRYLLHDEVAAVYACSTQQMLGEGDKRARDEDVQSLITLRRSKLTFQLHDSFLIPHIPTTLALYGSRGTLQIDHWADRARPSRLWLIENHRPTPLPIDTGHTPDSRSDSADRQLIFAFIQALRLYASARESGEATVLAPATAGIKSLQVALAAQQSLQAGHIVQLTNRDN
jgi:1,5-anhydro-D-fructose reductase (1,5-anhydro-D-mannitol-forming)